MTDILLIEKEKSCNLVKFYQLALSNVFLLATYSKMTILPESEPTTM